MKSLLLVSLLALSIADGHSEDRPFLLRRFRALENSERATIRVLAQERSPHRVPQFLTGKFAEHLGWNIYNGMDAQVLRNPTFATYSFATGQTDPDGVVTLGDPASGPRDNSSIWHLSTDAARYDLTYSADSNWYNLALQVAVLHPAGGGRDLRIPFPRTALDTTALTEGQQYINPWSADQWHDFYRDIASAEVNGDTITVTSAQGPTATIALGNGVATITISD